MPSDSSCRFHVRPERPEHSERNGDEQQAAQQADIARFMCAVAAIPGRISSGMTIAQTIEALSHHVCRETGAAANTARFICAAYSSIAQINLTIAAITPVYAMILLHRGATCGMIRFLPSLALLAMSLLGSLPSSICAELNQRWLERHIGGQQIIDGSAEKGHEQRDRRCDAPVWGGEGREEEGRLNSR